MKGDGRVFLPKRGGRATRYWHIAYWFDGREVRESSRSMDRRTAEILLAERLAARSSGRLVDAVTNQLYRFGRSGHGGVYFLQSVRGGPIKIGVARNVYARMAYAQVSSPDELVCLGITIGAGRNEERRLHRYFADSWIRGEWFAPTEDILRWIERCTTRPRPDSRPRHKPGAARSFEGLVLPPEPDEDPKVQ